MHIQDSLVQKVDKNRNIFPFEIKFINCSVLVWHARFIFTDNMINSY